MNLTHVVVVRDLLDKIDPKRVVMVLGPYEKLNAEQKAMNWTAALDNRDGKNKFRYHYTAHPMENAV